MSDKDDWNLVNLANLNIWKTSYADPPNTKIFCAVVISKLHPEQQVFCEIHYTGIWGAAREESGIVPESEDSGFTYIWLEW